MTVVTVNGQANAAVVLKCLLQQHGLPDLSSEGIDALSARFSTGLVLGHGVVSHDGKPLIDELRALAGNPENARFFANPVKADQPNTLTERYRAEIAASRKHSRISDADLARYTGTTRLHMEERQRAAQEK
ncbi:hypothetical protein [Bradyrhizobium diazoefficiens]|uniref:Uncharacterized protein n=1 Tax=Bradyrhizobium diazoefficiens TaxID=1355477 RepID=A0A810C2V1_9BRAD|nr:hypothetical protein XF9B_52030 [Bradyrhizobium diazoefficiens]BCF01318.1 hypothetical protein XF11B_53380 [Bradyrhizobium diazoefficiens]BCF09866.1 hypothetical protein XF12B_52390 [Bradyrhizobium diazoefficiens]BCF62354.1 hypothetical protein XF18B_53020 [Bradyrhizobium diazoefficiens]